MRNFYFFLLRLFKSPSFLLRKVQLGKGNMIEVSSFISKTEVGDYNYIGHGCVVDKTQVGNYCSIAAYVMCGGAEHSMEWWSTSFKISGTQQKKLTIIEDDVWIGTKATIKQGVKIGRGAVVGAHSLVLEDVPPYAIVVGTPAKVIRYRFSDDKIKAVQNSKFWELEPAEAKKVLDKLS